MTISSDSRDRTPEQLVHSETPEIIVGETNPELWVDLYGDTLFRFAMSRIGRTEVAEELVQETFISAMKAIHNFEGRSSVLTWLRTILKNKMIDFARKTKRESLVSYDEIGFDDSSHYFNSLGLWKGFISSWGATPASKFQEQEFLGVLSKCLSGMPDKIKNVFVLRVMDEVESETICNDLEITPSNFWVIMHRARLMLRTCIDKNWFNKG